MLVCASCFSDKIELSANFSSCTNCGNDAFIETDESFYKVFVGVHEQLIEKHNKLNEMTTLLRKAVKGSQEICMKNNDFVSSLEIKKQFDIWSD